MDSKQSSQISITKSIGLFVGDWFGRVVILGNNFFQRRHPLFKRWIEPDIKKGIASSSEYINLNGFKLNAGYIAKQIKDDLRDDWFVDPLDNSDQLSGKKVKEKVAQNIAINSGQYSPSSREMFNIPKPQFTVRYALETNIFDRAIYHGIANYLIDYYDPTIPERAMGHRVELNGTFRKKRMFRGHIKQWKDFEGLVKNKMTADKVLLVADIMNFYENIQIRDIKKTLESKLILLGESESTKEKIQSAINELIRYLEAWSYNKTYGLPQNRDASSFLANVVMSNIDESMLKLEYDYYRYMDDIKIVCNNKYQARLALKKLIIELRKYGLNVNSKKTKIVTDKDEIDKQFTSGNRKIEMIDTLWRSRKKEVLIYSLKILLDYANELIEAGDTQERAFRFCVGRIEKLCRCKEIVLPNGVLDKFTDIVIEQLDSQPSTSDQFVRYLKSAPLEKSHLEKIATFLLNREIAIYGWQNYQLWQLLILWKFSLPELKTLAISLIENNDLTSPELAGAILFIGATGDEEDKKIIVNNFKAIKSSLIQRSAIIAIHEVNFYDGEIDTKVAPHIFSEHLGTYKELQSSKYKGVYCVAPEPIPYKKICDEVESGGYE